MDQKLDRSESHWTWKPYSAWYMTEDYLKYLADMVFKFQFRLNCQNGPGDAVKLNATYKRMERGNKVYTVEFEVHNKLKANFRDWLDTVKDAWRSVKDLNYMKEL